MKKPLKITCIILGSVIALLIVALLLLSPIAKSYIHKHDKELIGREVNIKTLRVNLLAGKVKIKDLVLFEDDAVTPFLRIDHFETKIKLWDLLHRQVTIKRILFSGLKLNIQQDRSWFNFNSLLDFF